MDQEKIVHYYEMYSDTVYRIGFSYLKNKNDADDVVQETFLRLVRQNGGFESDEHVKAWLIVTAANFCKSLLGHWWNKRVDIEDTEIPVESCEDEEYRFLYLGNATTTLEGEAFEGMNEEERERQRGVTPMWRMGNDFSYATFVCDFRE